MSYKITRGHFTVAFSLLPLFLLWFLQAVPVYAQLVKSITPEYRQHTKLAPSLGNFLKNNPSEEVRVYITNYAAFSKWITSNMPGVFIKISPIYTKVVKVSGLKATAISLLASCPWVEFIDVSDRIPKEELSVENADLSLNAITAVHRLYPQLDGNGFNVSVKERPFDTTDIDFKGRIIPSVSQKTSPSIHATTMATLIAGGGNSSLKGKGVAWKARLKSSDFSNLLPDDVQQLQQSGITIQNHSYGVDIENYYGIESHAYDQHTRQFPQIVHVFSSGNLGTDTSTSGTYATIPGFANLTGQFKMSKNTLSVGATDPTGQVAPLSSKGPAYDGRIKPELVAYGDGGTSESAALVSGMCVLVQQAYQEKYGSLPPAALVKTLLINSANDTGQPGIDFETGFGLADALGAVRTVVENRFASGIVEQKETNQFKINVPPGMQELKITLSWHDREAEPNANSALVNDLDLEVFHLATGDTWKPWVLNHYPHPDSLILPANRQTDHLNNVEQISVENPEAGEYIFQVTGYNIPSGTQDFSLAYEWETGFAWTNPSENSSMQVSTPNYIRWQWKGIPIEATLSYRSLPGNQWHEIGLADLSLLYYEWIPPDSLTQVQLRLEYDTVVQLSDTFTVTKTPALEVGYNCEDELLLQWPAIPEATHYKLYRMENMFLEPFMLLTDTLVLLNKEQKQNVYYAVVPMNENRVLGRSLTIDYTKQEIGCYIKSFLPKELVTDTIGLELQLSAVLRLESVYLEKWVNGSFQAIQQLSPVSNLNYSLTDPLAEPGRNLYRIRVENIDKKSYYSQEEAVFYIRKGELLVFPNPVASGQRLNVALSEDEAITITFIDLSGKRILSISETGEMKAVFTSLLPKGTYIMQVQTQNGEFLHTRIVVY